MRRAGRLGDGRIISFAEHLVELADKVKTYQDIAAEPRHFSANRTIASAR